MKKISLRRRFLFAIVGFSVGTWLLGFLLLVTIITPEIPNRLVLLDEEAKLSRLALQCVESGRAPDRSTLGPYVSLESVQALQGDSSVLTHCPIPGTQNVLVSRRPLGLREAGQVLSFRPYRRLAAILTALFLMYLLATRLESFVSRPLTEFRYAVERLAAGERQVSVTLPVESELAELGEAFNRMSCLLADREEKLKSALASKDLLFASTSHELRTPLTVILGYVQMLEDGLKGPLTQKQSECVQVLKRNTIELLNQVENLLLYARPAEGVEALQSEPVDLRDLVEEVAANLQPTFEDRGLALVVELGGRELPALLDYQKGRQILTNLLSNAAKFAEKGRVNVKVLDRGVEVSDSGPGIEAQYRDKIFQEFHRVKPSGKAPGLGLGLPLARKFAREMGGEVELLRSDSEGSTFLWRIAASGPRL